MNRPPIPQIKVRVANPKNVRKVNKPPSQNSKTNQQIVEPAELNKECQTEVP